MFEDVCNPNMPLQVWRASIQYSLRIVFRFLEFLYEDQQRVVVVVGGRGDVVREIEKKSYFRKLKIIVNGHPNISYQPIVLLSG